MEHCGFCDIVYDEKDCPLCKANDKIRDLEDQIGALEDDLADLERGE